MIYKKTQFGTIPNHWEVKSLADIGIIKGRIGWRGYTVDDIKESGPYVLGAGDITTDNKVDLSKAKHLSVEKYEESPEIMLEKGDTLIVKVGSTIGKVGFFNFDNTQATINPNSVLFRTITAHPAFVYYYLCTRFANNFLISNSPASAQPAINQSTIKQMPVIVPPLNEQKAIANILSSFDDKIELNNKINKNLEELAQTLYKRWFVDFEFPNEYGEPYKSSGGEMVESELGKIPMDWSIKSIGDYSTVKSGYAFKSAWWSNKGLGVIKIKDLNDITINENNLDRVEHFYATKAMEFSVNFGDILIAMTGATLGKIGIVSSKKSNLYVNQRVGKFFLGEHPIKKLPFLHNLLRNKDILEEIIRRGSGSAQSNISPSDIMSIKIPYKKEVINSFNIIFEYIYKTYLNNLEQNKILSKTRDELLPKLMNGEIEVPIEE